MAVIEVYAFATPNSVKVSIALEELGLEYVLRPVNIRAGAQKDPAFVARNANAKVPVLVDTNVTGDPLMLSESAAILVYLAEKTVKLLPRSGERRARVRARRGVWQCRLFPQARARADTIGHRSVHQ
jgi:glutathione S-transferase